MRNGGDFQEAFLKLASIADGEMENQAVLAAQAGFTAPLGVPSRMAVGLYATIFGVLAAQAGMPTFLVLYYYISCARP